MKKQIRVIVKNPGMRAEPRIIPNTLEELQGFVGGHIEVWPLAPGAVIICNEEGKLLGLPYNLSVRHEHFVGPLIFCGVDGEDFDDWSGGFARLDRLIGKEWRV